MRVKFKVGVRLRVRVRTRARFRAGAGARDGARAGARASVFVTAQRTSRGVVSDREKDKHIYNSKEDGPLLGYHSCYATANLHGFSQGYG